MEKNKGDQFNLDLPLGSPFSILCGCWQDGGTERKKVFQGAPVQAGTPLLQNSQLPSQQRVLGFTVCGFAASGIQFLCELEMLLSSFLITLFRGSKHLDLHVYNPFLLRFTRVFLYREMFIAGDKRDFLKK